MQHLRIIYLIWGFVSTKRMQQLPIIYLTGLSIYKTDATSAYNLFDGLSIYKTDATSSYNLFDGALYLQKQLVRKDQLDFFYLM